MMIPDPERYDHADETAFPAGSRAPFAKAIQGAGSVGKMAFIAILIGLLLIPVGMVESLIREREYNGTSAEQEVAGKWGGSQQVTGPILTVPYRVFTQREKGKTDTSIEYAHFLPEDLSVTGSLEPEIRHRGIYDVALFRANLHLTGHFARPDFSGWRVAPENILWDAAFVTLAVPDVRSLAGEVPLSWNGKTAQCLPDNFVGSPVSAGLHAPVNMAPQASGKEVYPFEMSVALNGSGSMQFLPMGKETRVSLASPWKTPSFSGAFLPRENRVDAQGFTANWATFHLSRSFPQSWRGSEITEANWDRYAFGVDLKLPVDRYQKTNRCAKYAVLFIVLTFLIFFMNETFDRRRIHPLQYVLVGCALCLFYLLLLALTEQVPFGYAYAIATAGIVGMITAYGAAVLSTRKRAYALGGMLACLYAYLYSLLQMEDFSLLMGALGLFAILGGVMYLTRKLNRATSTIPAPGAA
ncbi:MAG: cell envelope integrity protein CreD [Fibrobacteres bacterium]|nr:cell envelope integrity protein CreD [Fibrobacterota bacterium]